MYFEGKIIKLEKEVIQGSVLSPGYFNQYILKFVKEMVIYWGKTLNEGSLQMYADDIILITKKLDQLIKALNKANEVLNEEWLEVNQIKSKIITLDQAAKNKIPKSCQKIPFSNEGNILGLNINLIFDNFCK